jgi:predicted permease
MQDLKFAIRQLMRKPGFSAVAVLTLALGIGANTAIFSLINSLLLRMLPVASPAKLVLFGDGKSAGSTDGMPSGSRTLFSYPMFHEFQRNNGAFTDVAAMKSLLFRVHGRVKGNQELERLQIQLVSGSYFPMLGVHPWQGRLLGEADDRNAGGHPVAVANAAWWGRRFGEGPFDAEKTINIGGTIYAIVGLTPKQFFGTTVGESPDLWIPLSMEKEISPGWNGLTNELFQSLHLIARLKDGIDIRKAQAEVNVLYNRMLRNYAGATPTRNDLRNIQQARIELTPAARGLSELRRQLSAPLMVLMGVVVAVLLIACANVANLLLARAIGRQREFAIRIAIGAGRWRLVRQLLTESVLLAVGGAAAGLLFAEAAGRGLAALVSTGPQPLPIGVELDLTALLFTSALAILTTFLFGLAPALRATRTACAMELKTGKDSSGAPGKNALGRALLAGQVALSVCLLGAAGLFLRTLVNLTKIETGFSKQNVLLISLDESSAGYQEDGRLENLYGEIERRVGALPGVQAASISFFTFNQGGWTTMINTAKPVALADRMVSHNIIGDDYFKAMGVPLLAGRAFGPQDTTNSTKIAIVNETLAEKYFAGRSPLGQRFRIGRPDAGPENEREIVGIVKDAKYENLRERPLAAAFYPHSQHLQYLENLVVRFSGEPGPVIAAVRKTIAEIDANVPLANVRTLTQEIDRSIVDQRLTAQISAFFALLALVLACIGIYGVISYWVSGQTREIGIRMALGAQPRQVLSMVARQGFNVVALGVCIGAPAILTTQQVVSTQLYGLSALDPGSLAAAVGCLAVSAALAGFLPARRAAKVDPMVALRYE